MNDGPRGPRDEFDTVTDGSGAPSADRESGDGLDAAALADAFETALVEAEVGVMLVDADGTVRWGNDPVAEFFGVDNGSLVGTAWDDIAGERVDYQPVQPTDGESDRSGRFECHVRATADRPERYLDYCRGAVSSGPCAGGRTELYYDTTERKRTAKRLREEQAFTSSVFEALPGVVYIFDDELTGLRWNERLNQVTGYTDEEIGEMEVLDFVPPEDHPRIRSTVRRILAERTAAVGESALVTKAGERIPYEFTVAPMTDASGDVVGVAGIGRDITVRNERERKLRAQRNELRRLDHVNSVIRDIGRALVRATTRAEAETSIVDRLAAADPYAFAVIGEFDPTLTRFTPHAFAGVEEWPCEGLLPATGGENLSANPGAAAVRGRSVEVVQDLQAESVVGPWRRDASERGYRHLAAIPLATGDRVHGVLGVYTDRSDGFDDRERAVLQELGETIADTFAALETSRLVYADRVVELELLLTDDSHVFVDLTAKADCHLVLDHVVAVGESDGDETLLYYLTLVDGDPERFQTLAADDPRIDRVRRIDGADPCFEFAVGGETLTSLFEGYGAKTLTASVNRGSCQLTAEASPDASVRNLVTAVQEVFPSTVLVARRDVERSLESTAELQQRFVDDLTGRQRTALEVAYHGGYFDWPTRGSDAADVAAALDITPQTLHQHLRVAQRKVFAALFENAE